MITGDHPLTARQIATELGITNNGRVLTGQEVETDVDAELKDAVVEMCRCLRACRRSTS